MNRVCRLCGEVSPPEAHFCGRDGTILVQEQVPGDFDPRLGLNLRDYVIVARVADGAMGRVYEGRHMESRARVAVKVLHRDLLADSVSVARFQREYETVSELHNPYIVEVLECGRTDDGSYFIVMEYLDGEELNHRIQREGAVPVALIVRLLSQAALALDYAHAFGVVHRDLKPDNLYVCNHDGELDVRLLDFGSVKLQLGTGPKLTALGTTLGSPYYMSPEQAMGRQDVDSRTDVFALGAIAYEMITGKVAFEGRSIAEILMRIVQGSPDPIGPVAGLNVSRVQSVIDRAISKDKTKRWRSTSEFVGELLLSFGIDGNLQRWSSLPVSAIAAELRSASTPTAVRRNSPPPFKHHGPSAPRTPRLPVEAKTMKFLRPSEPSIPTGRPTPGANTYAWLAAFGLAVVAFGLWIFSLTR